MADLALQQNYVLAALGYMLDVQDDDVPQSMKSPKLKAYFAALESRLRQSNVCARGTDREKMLCALRFGITELHADPEKIRVAAAFMRSRRYWARPDWYVLWHQVLNPQQQQAHQFFGLGATNASTAMFQQYNDTSNKMIAVWALAVAAGLGLTGYIVYRVTK